MSDQHMAARHRPLDFLTSFCSFPSYRSSLVVLHAPWSSLSLGRFVWWRSCWRWFPWGRVLRRARHRRCSAGPARP